MVAAIYIRMSGVFTWRSSQRSKTVAELRRKIAGRTSDAAAWRENAKRNLIPAENN